MARSPKKPAAKKPAAKKPARPVKALAKTVTVARKASAAMKKQFDDVTAKMTAASRQESRGWDAYFELMGTMLRDKLWIAGGFDSAAQWLESVSDEPIRSLRRNVRVAESSSPEEQEKYKRSKITLALALFDARDAKAAKQRGEEWKTSDEPRSVDWNKLTFEVVRDGKKRKLSLDEVTAPELQALIDSLHKAPNDNAHKATETEGALRETLDARGLGEVSVAQRDHRYTLSGARADQLEALGRALIEAARAIAE